MTRYCDIVMKGGVTSGIVYPPAIVALSAEYAFKNVGGTSAGAVAAAATAAAEYARRNGDTESFARLAHMTDDLRNKPGFLLSLFASDEMAKPAFDAALAFQRPGGPVQKLAAAVRALFRAYPIAIAIFVAGILLPWAIYGIRLAFHQPDQAFPYVVLTASTAILGAGGALGYVFYRAYVDTVGCLRTSFLGLCTGFSRTGTPSAPPLTNWLHQQLNSLAGVTDRPVVFGDLWHAKLAHREEPVVNDRVINLEVISTNLTHGCPYRIPFADVQFYFDPAEFERLFPADIVQWMKVHARAGTHRVTKIDGTVLMPLPEMADLPLLIAVRMSLSFPILLSAVPLYAVDFSVPGNQDKDEAAVYLGERCWFSDGGICSNFPIHFFDGPLPRWPTFGISLDTPDPQHPEVVWMPDSNAGGLLPRFNPLDERRPLTFVAAIVSTAMSWRDSMQMRLPGFRDRIVHIRLPDALGGLHLDMTKPKIEQLSGYGAEAGQMILKTFRHDDHIWARYRSTMCMLQRLLERFANNYQNPAQQDGAVWPAITDPVVVSPPHYALSPDQHAWTCTETAKLVEMAQRWSTSNAFCDRAPHPEPELRAVPRP